MGCKGRPVFEADSSNGRFRSHCDIHGVMMIKPSSVHAKWPCEANTSGQRLVQDAAVFRCLDRLASKMQQLLRLQSVLAPTGRVGGRGWSIGPRYALSRSTQANLGPSLRSVVEDPAGSSIVICPGNRLATQTLTQLLSLSSNIPAGHITCRTLIASLVLHIISTKI